MYSSVEYWSSGAKEWSATHDAQKGMYNLEAGGALPNSFEPLKNKISKDQDAEGGEKGQVKFSSNS